MYCPNCHRQTPDNFVKCPYCSHKLQKGKKQVTDDKASKKNKGLNFKKSVIAVIIIAACLVVAAVVTGVATGSKPKNVVKTLAESIDTDNKNLYYSLYDDEIKEYNKENWYFDDEQTLTHMTEPLRKAKEFYTQYCGEDFSVKYEISSVEYAQDTEIEYFNKTLNETYGYRKSVSQIAYIDFSLYVKGSAGEYESVYTDFRCIKINGKWYRDYTNISTQTEGNNK